MENKHMDKSRLPRHVAVIMDGNGRWAGLRGKERVYGHHEGAESVRACSEYAVETGIEYLSFFAFSEENWKRPEAEVTELMHLMAVSILNERPTFRKNNIRFVVIGNRSRLSDALNRDIDLAMEETSGNPEVCGGRCSSGTFRGLSGNSRYTGPGSSDKDQRRTENQQFHALAVCIHRILFY